MKFQLNQMKVNYFWKLPWGQVLKILTWINFMQREEITTTAHQIQGLILLPRSFHDWNWKQTKVIFEKLKVKGLKYLVPSHMFLTSEVHQIQKLWTKYRSIRIIRKRIIRTWPFNDQNCTYFKFLVKKD